MPNDYHDRFHPVAGRELLERMQVFPILAAALRAPGVPMNPIRGLTESTHRTTAQLARLLCAHFYDGDAGGVDVIELIRLLDRENKAAFLAFLEGL